MRSASFLAAMVGVAGAAPELCLSDPPIQLVAGYSNISAVHENPFRETCEAVLQFMEWGFPSITYTFDETRPCSGSQVVSFLVPLEAPNGSARVIWQCAELSSCSFANITDGTGDPSLVSQQNGTVGCLPAGFAANASTVAVNGSLTTAMGADLPDPTITDRTPHPSSNRSGFAANQTSQPTASGNRSDFAANQTSLPTASGNRSDIIATDLSSQPAASGNRSDIIATDLSSQPAAGGNRLNFTATDQSLQPAASGNRSDFTATDQSLQPAASGDSSSFADKPAPTAVNSTDNPQPPGPTDTGITAANGAGRGWDLSGAWTITVTQTVTTLMTSMI